MEIDAPRRNCAFLVAHTRKATFAMMLVSAIATTAALFQDTEQLDQAVAELRLVESLAKKWQKRIPTHHAYPLAGIIARPEDRDIQKIITLRVELKELDLFWSKNVGPTFKCEFILDPLGGFMSNDDHAHQYVIVEPTEGGSAALMNTTERGDRVAWTMAKNLPTNVAEFRGFWNLLHKSRVATLSSIEEDRAIVIKETSIQGLRGVESGLPIPYSIRKVERAEAQSGSSTWPSTLQVFSTSDITIDKFQPYKKFGNPKLLESSGIEKLDDWDRNGMALVVTNESCKDHERNSLAMVMPAELSFTAPDLTHEIVEHGFEREEWQSRETFDATFSALNEVSKGFETVPYDSLVRFLEYRIRYEGQAVSFFDVRFPLDLLHLVGVIVVVFVQAYATIHLGELAKRMGRTRRGDPGAYGPWILLYNQAGARCLSVFVILTPTLSVLVLHLSDGHGGWQPLSVSWWVGTVGFAASTFLAIVSLVHARRLSFFAKRHRRYRGGDR